MTIPTTEDCLFLYSNFRWICTLKDHPDDVGKGITPKDAYENLLLIIKNKYGIP